MTLAGRAEIRDLIDILYLHQHHLHLGALVWAAVGKDPGFTAETLPSNSVNAGFAMNRGLVETTGSG